MPCLHGRAEKSSGIGRLPATEMKRSGIEVGAGNPKKRPAPEEFRRMPCLHGRAEKSSGIGRLPATEMKRSGIEVGAGNPKKGLPC